VARIEFERRLSLAGNLTFEENVELRQNRYGEGVELFRDVQIEERFINNVDAQLTKINEFFDSCSEEFNSQTMPIEMKRKYFENIYFDRCRNAIYRACQKAFGSENKMYSLVDARSTFAACRKLTQGLEKTAMEMGHSGVTTTRDKYAPMAKAWAVYRHTGQLPVSTQAQNMAAAESMSDMGTAPAVGNAS